MNRWGAVGCSIADDAGCSQNARRVEHPDALPNLGDRQTGLSSDRYESRRVEIIRSTL